MSNVRKCLLALLTGFAVGFAFGAPAWAHGDAPAQAKAHIFTSEINLAIGHTAIFDGPEPFAVVINGNPKLVQAEVRSHRQLVLFGLAEGETELRLMNSGVEVGRVTVRVTTDVGPLETLLRQTVGPDVHAAHIGASVVLTGNVSNAGQVSLAGDIAHSAFGQQGATVVNLLKSSGSDEVSVSVQVLEVKRSKLKSVGLKWAVTNKGSQGATQIGNIFSGAISRPTDQFSAFATTSLSVGHNVIDAFVDLLRSEGEARLLAQPTIVAASGRPAKFLSGGEFPVPAPTGFVNNATAGQAATNSFEAIIYKQFGISLGFTASILADGRIELQVTPEVSSIDSTRSIEYGGNHVPALATRRADTFLRMNSGDSIVFAGLTSQDYDRTRLRLPFGGTRVLDFLAGPSSDSSDETELIIIVTPVIGGQAPRPTDLK